MSAIVIARASGGCWPGTLHCDCGGAELAIWTPELGARCSSCGRSYVRADRQPLGPGSHILREVPPIKGLEGWAERGSRKGPDEPRPAA